MATHVLNRLLTMSRLATGGAALGAVMALGACTGLVPVADQTTPLPVQEAHPITAEMKTFSVLVPIKEVSGARSLLPADFVAEYQRRGRGPVMIYLPNGAESTNAARAVAGFLDDRAIPVKAMRGGNDSGMIVPDMLVVTYQAYVATVPECGTNSQRFGISPTNMAEADYGCSYQRNIGLMVSDPGDIARPRIATGSDTQRAADVITKYREGTNTGAGTQMGETVGLDTGN